jgi:SNF2 family DNA or RNA helicase
MIEGLTVPSLFKKQDEYHERAFGKRYFACFPDLGTGKTFMILREMLTMWQADMVDGILIVSPVDIYAQWLDELAKFTSTPYRSSAWPEEPVFTSSQWPRIFCIYPEAFRLNKKASTKVFKMLQKFLKSGRIGLCIDESQMIGALRSKQRRRIQALKRLASYRRITSGYPAPKKIQFLPQYNFLSTEILKTKTKEAFQQDFCEMGGFMGKKITGYKNDEEFLRRTAPWTFTCKLEDCMDMPERTWIKIPVKLSDEQRRLIQEIKKDFRAQLGKDVIFLPHVLQRLTRIQQVTCGFLPKLNDKGETIGIRWLKEYRTEALENWLERVNGKVIIWVYYKPSLNRLFDHFDDGSAVKYQGGMSREEKADAKNRFMHDPKCTRLFAQPKSLGAGVNGLTVARYSIYWNNVHDSQPRKQTERRTWRAGQSKACVYADLCAAGTYDEKIAKTVMNSMEVSDSLMKDIATWVNL